MEQHGHLDLDPGVRTRLLTASAATLDRSLKPIRPTAGSRRRRRRRQSMSKRVPVCTYKDWDRPPPGFLEIDLVAHCGGPLSGSFIHSLVATDICTGWTEAVPLLAREQSLVVAGLEVIGQRLPFPVLGIDSDNDSVFINETVVQYCAGRGIEFTRSRAYRSNDQAWIEQKNGSVVRRFVGHDRYSGQVAGQTMAYLYEALRLYVNFFQPSFKLIDKSRDGATTVKHYSQPTTPCDRLIQHDTTGDEMTAALQTYRADLDPVLLLHSIREAQSALVAATTLEVRETPSGESLERFLAKFPSLWRQGEVRPTHAVRVRAPRHWRTRKDPFEGVWGDVLVWLKVEPDVTGKTLMARLRLEHPDRFSGAQLRTMQRRVKEWRGIMAKNLVYASPAASSAAPSKLPKLVLVGADSGC